MSVGYPDFDQYKLTEEQIAAWAEGFPKFVDELERCGPRARG